MIAPAKLCACGCGQPIPPEELAPDNGPQYLDECWFRRADVRRILSEKTIETLKTKRRQSPEKEK